ncbi:hypothetical protein D5086_004763 [Populus alba]|uniref:Uncharacterized protein n=1 Tax=Populus alba TaxID=43335 RepID=A0ACC4CRB9_POPAL
MKFKSLAVKHLADNTIPNDSVLESRMEYFVLQFNKEGDKVVEEFKLRVVYIPANPPSPVPEESDEGSSPPRPSVLENGYQDSSLLDAVSRTLEEPKEKSFETWSLISRLTEEKTSALQQNQKLQHELELMRKQISKKHAGGVSLLVAFLISLFGILAGYIFK